jgi:septum formation protein
VRVILASGSPRRRELLARIVHPFEVRPPHLDETRRPGEPPEAYTRRMAEEKALCVSARDRDAFVLAADTIVTIDGDVLGKPRDDADAAAMLARLSGRTHRVLSAIAWARRESVALAELVSSEVSFRALSDAEIARYVATGEPRDKAGAYAIQGGAAAFVRSVTGSVTSVIGLPLAEAEIFARRLGIPEPAALSDEAIALRYRSIVGEVAAHAVAAGRAPESVRVIAVGKGHPVEAALAAVAAGATELGENYVQEGAAKRKAADDRAGRVRWHLIGPLQRNKARLAAATFDVVQTIDRLETAEALVRGAAAAADSPRDVLVQVNVARDAAKSGVSLEALEPLLLGLKDLPGLRVAGLMTIGAADETAERARADFRRLRESLTAMRSRGLVAGAELSMGMSGDYDVAIAEGATWVRLGTAIFGPRQAAKAAKAE